MFISIDGIDGAGKTTQLDLLCEALADKGHTIARFRDPGSTPLGETVRDILLHREDIPLCSQAEMLLYMTARAQLVSEKLQPALEQRQTIITDRFLLANVVYQGCAGGLNVDDIWNVGKVATQGLMPDRTILLDIPADVALPRIQRQQDRLEKRGMEYFAKVRAGFLEQIQRLESPYLVVDATKSIDKIHDQIVAFVEG